MLYQERTDCKTCGMQDVELASAEHASYCDNRHAVEDKPLCGFCGRTAENPRKVVASGEIRECCVGVLHDPYVVPNSNHSAFVARARKAGIDGKW